VERPTLPRLFLFKRAPSTLSNPPFLVPSAITSASHRLQTALALGSRQAKQSVQSHLLVHMYDASHAAIPATCHARHTLGLAAAHTLDRSGRGLSGRSRRGEAAPHCHSTVRDRSRLGMARHGEGAGRAWGVNFHNDVAYRIIVGTERSISISRLLFR
jgi:hypothetical protein